MEEKRTLYYVHDPMCSWCWAFVPAWEKIQRDLPSDIEAVYLLGGLAPDSSVPMPEQMKLTIAGYWKTIQERVPGTQFNYDFWTQCQPRRSTYPSCRAVLAAKAQAKDSDEAKVLEQAMIKAIQEGYYLNARNPSDFDTLIAFAKEIGLDAKRFELELNSESTIEKLNEEIQLSRSIGAQGFPSLILNSNKLAEAEDSKSQKLKNVQWQNVPYDYNDASVTLRRL
ncbi:DsbA family protein [Alteromonas sp. BL110]|uniref:DsbA family protein n=1 Tax=Alteromonas sp. BL110 TaxID=1714845 RepID=UPI000E467FB4|nr:DsbA family protein [Alteromonas sp. BL110]AXT37487.1 DsbA family protein [Alteromonas sp. BL110]RKM80225.1 DsbA family protein [Alteromonas sp. BL110]